MLQTSAILTLVTPSIRILSSSGQTHQYLHKLDYSTLIERRHGEQRSCVAIQNKSYTEETMEVVIRSKTKIDVY